ncbi:MAG: hypothetical protein U0289_14485 [Cyclobacteriaceae bacterium]|jgi:hypothetical protein|nr:hypothetical protein [Cytophagales bacterium]HNP75782.1 hypothetical protein [Cyclobacteriaceae bacterium]HQQ82157.1 hypothetical protein [Cyclobacteriaceae bacterium]
MEAIIEFGKILLPASLVLYAVYLTVRSFIHRELESKRMEIRARSIETILPNRLQAYERMCLFLERISPPNLLLRLNNPGYTAREFHKVLLDEIRNEYNHNVSQQIYMSDEVWNMIRNAKEDLTILINEASAGLEGEATALDLSRRIFELTLEKKVEPISHALVELKKEIQQTF